jgi:peptide chain release factor 1
MELESKLQTLVDELKNIDQELMNPDVVSDQNKYKNLMVRRSELDPVVVAFKSYQDTKQNLEDAKSMLADESDAEMKEFYQNEFESSTKKLEKLEEELKKALIPKDPKDYKNCIIEVRAGAGGDEASLFAGELARMYMRYGEQNGFTSEILSQSDNDTGGVKEIVFQVNGPKPYGTFKFESGVHRVQRVPVTESQGRIHTSAASVVVLPEVDDIDINLDPNDLRIDVFRSSGPGGQSVNTTDSAIRITHEPTGITVSCQDEKSQHKNKDKAMAILKSRLFDLEEAKRQKELGAARQSSIGSGDRSEKIRTYNFPQDRVTDHRIKESWNNLPSILDGNLQDIIEAIQVAEQARLLAEASKTE